MNIKDCKPNTRVVMYDKGRFVGTIKGIVDDKANIVEVFVLQDSYHYDFTAHVCVQQLRKLVKKQRKSVWVLDDITERSSPLQTCLKIKPDDRVSEYYTEYVENKRK